MTAYEVNVRAVVTCETQDRDAPVVIDGWDVTSVETEEAEDGFLRATVRCEQLVRIDAESERKAIEKAKDNASLIEIEGWNLDEAKLWVDPGVDVEFAPGYPTR